MSDIVHVIRATSDPVSAPTREGQHWVNTATNGLWFSVGVATVADWVIYNYAMVVATTKAGRLLNSDFSGNPKKATIIFASTLATPYAINVSGVDTRVWTIESITINGFTINSNANLALTGDVFWEVQQTGEF